MPVTSTSPTAPASAPSAETAWSRSTVSVRSRVISLESAEVSAWSLEASDRVRWRSEMSRAIIAAPSGTPSASRIGETVSETTISRPSLVRRSVS